MRDPPFFELPDERRPDDLADDFPLELLEPLLADEDFDLPDDFDFTAGLFDPEDFRVALALEDLREELPERAFADDRLLPLDS